MSSLRILGAIVLLVTSSCGGGSEMETSDSGATDASTGAETRPPPSGGCVPGCHYDCLDKSLHCTDAGVFKSVPTAIPCCRASDARPACPKIAYGTCEHGCSTNTPTPDPRYWKCATTGRFEATVELPPHVLRLACADGVEKQMGDGCTTDDDCRPAKDGIPALHCVSSVCAWIPRPEAAPSYGATCGLTVDPTEGLDEFIVATPSCPTCYITSSPDGCVHQACTKPCEYDEDCPAGSVCTCADGGDHIQFVCIATMFRDDGTARRAFAKCWSKPDAG